MFIKNPKPQCQLVVGSCQGNSRLLLTDPWQNWTPPSLWYSWYGPGSCGVQPWKLIRICNGNSIALLSKTLINRIWMTFQLHCLWINTSCTSIIYGVRLGKMKLPCLQTVKSASDFLWKCCRVWLKKHIMANDTGMCTYIILNVSAIDGPLVLLSWKLHSWTLHSVLLSCNLKSKETIYFHWEHYCRLKTWHYNTSMPDVGLWGLFMSYGCMTHMQMYFHA